MSLFRTRKPRGFEHHFIYVDERKERLEQLERRAKGELGMSAEQKSRIDPIRGTFRNDRLRHHQRMQHRVVIFYLACLVILLLALMVLSLLA